MEYKEHKMGTYTLHTIKTDKFKLCHMEIIFRNNLNTEEITMRNVLFDLLTESNKNYPTKRDLALKLEELYNAFYYSVNNKLGNGMITNLCMDFLNPKYTEKAALEEAISMPFDMIFNPLARSKEFDPRTVSLVKDRIAADIKSVKESPKKYALIEALKSLGDKTPSSVSGMGNLEDLEVITPSSLYKYYEKVLKHDHVDIYIIGDLNMNEVVKIISNHAQFKVIKEKKLDLYVKNNKTPTKIVKDKFIYVQTNIVLILHLNNLTEYEKKYVAYVYNIILGGGSLETKLYKALRGENSLCYNVGSMYQKYDGLILINTAIDINAREKAIKLIKGSIKDMTNKITEEELEAAQMTVISSLSMSMDNIGRIVDNYFYHHVSDLDDFETRLKIFKKVSIEDIYKFAKKVGISTIYALEGCDPDA